MFNLSQFINNLITSHPYFPSSPSMPHPLLPLLNTSTLKMAVCGVDSIFHASALKQVPSCGFLPMEAVKTNVMGTDHVLDAAVDANCRWSPIQRLAADGRGV